jgi:hypothetical protein
MTAFIKKTSRRSAFDWTSLRDKKPFRKKSLTATSSNVMTRKLCALASCMNQAGGAGAAKRAPDRPSISARNGMVHVKLRSRDRECNIFGNNLCVVVNGGLERSKIYWAGRCNMNLTIHLEVICDEAGEGTLPRLAHRLPRGMVCGVSYT